MFGLESIRWWCALPLITGLVLVLLRTFDSYSKARYYFWYVIGIGLGIIVTLCMAVPLSLFRPKNPDNCRVVADVVKHFFPIFGMDIYVRNGHILEGEQGAIVCPNHQSFLDIGGMLTAFKYMRKCRLVAAKEVQYKYYIGPVAWFWNPVFIDRSNATEAMKTLQNAAQAISDKTKLWIFPEGTRNSSGKFLPFKAGAFKIAIECQAPIIPVVYSPYYFLDHSTPRARNGKVIVNVLEPISTKGLTSDDVGKLRDQCFNVMSAAYEELRREVETFIPVEFRHSLFIHNFTRKYLLHGPIAANFFRHQIPIGGLNN